MYQADNILGEIRDKMEDGDLNRKDLEGFERAAFNVIDYITFWEDLTKEEQDKINKERDA